MCKKLIQNRSDGRRQIVYYQSGVGSETDFKGEEIAVASLALSACHKLTASTLLMLTQYHRGDGSCRWLVILSRYRSIAR